jgi:hypothetical protein
MLLTCLTLKHVMDLIEPPKAVDVEILTIPEIAYLTGLERGTVERWRRADPEKRFIDPDDYLGSIPVWRLERVTAWLDESWLKMKDHKDYPTRLRSYDVKAWRQHRADGGFRRRTIHRAMR